MLTVLWIKWTRAHLWRRVTVEGLQAVCRIRPHLFCECSPNCRRPRRQDRATARAPSQSAPTPRGAVQAWSALQNRKARRELKSASSKEAMKSASDSLREEQQLSPLRIKIRVIEAQWEKRLMVSRRNDRVWGH